MPLWQWVVDGLGAVLVLVLLYGLGLVFRRRWIARGGDAFELSFRVRSTKAGRGWVLGLGRYSGEAVEFFRIFSLSPRPMRVLDRAGLEFLEQRAPTGPEAHSLYLDHVILTCRNPTERFELAMTPSAATGFLAWLEAAPPGRGTLPM
jgi:hypothetical protein